MKKQRSQEPTALYLLAWSCLDFILSDALESSATTPAEVTSIKEFLGDVANGTVAQTNLSVQCTALLPPRDGFYYIEEGSGHSLGSVITYWCIEGYQLVGNGKLTCLLKGSVFDWSHSPPHCEVIPKPLDKGFRVAVIASLISGLIIVAMSIAFAICCLRDRMMKGATQRSENSEEQQPRKRFKFGTGKFTKQEAVKSRNHFGKMKHNRRLHYRTSALYSCAHPGALAGYHNQGLQRKKKFNLSNAENILGKLSFCRLSDHTDKEGTTLKDMSPNTERRSQKNLVKGPSQSLCSEIHIFPQVVLKSGAVSSASMFVHLPQNTDVPLRMKHCNPSLPHDIPSIYYRQIERLDLLDK